MKPARIISSTPLGKGRGGRIGNGGVRSDGHRDLHAFAGPLIFMVMVASILVNVPVHPRGFSVVDLHPVHPDIPLAVVEPLCEDDGQGDEPPPVFRPAMEDGYFH